jgi:microcompartment protein CcmL/EutN
MTSIEYIAHFLFLTILGFACYLIFPGIGGWIVFSIVAIFYISHNIKKNEQEEKEKKENEEKFAATMRRFSDIQLEKESEERRQEIELHQIELKKKIEQEQFEISSKEEDILVL